MFFLAKTRIRKTQNVTIDEEDEDYDGSGDGTTNCYHQDYYCNPTAENLIHRVVHTAITKVSDCSDECNKYENDSSKHPNKVLKL